MKHIKVHGVDEDTTQFNTIKELKDYISNIPDDTPVYLYGVGVGGTVYNVCGSLRAQDCVEHSGKKHTVTGFLLEVDG